MKKRARPPQKKRFNPQLIGMVHLPALPGAAGAKLSMRDIVRGALAEARTLEKAGFDALIIENFGDAPFAADRVYPETVATMAVVVSQVIAGCRVPVGVNVLRNDAISAIAVAAATGAVFIRVNVLSGTYATDQGLITGRADELLRRRAAVCPQVLIAADVHVKHATPISQPDLAMAAEETAYRGGADILIVSGAGTGKPTELDAVRRVKEAVPDRPVWIGSGVRPDTVGDDLSVADGVIVGTSLKKGGHTTAALDAGRIRAFMRAARK